MPIIESSCHAAGLPGRHQRPAVRQSASADRDRPPTGLGPGYHRDPDREYALQRLRPAPGLKHLHAEQPILGDPGTGSQVSVGSIGVVAALRALQHRRAGAVEFGRASDPQGRPIEHHPPGTAAVSHHFLQSRARRGAGRCDQENQCGHGRNSGPRNPDRQLSGRGAGVPVFARGNGHVAGDVDFRDLSGAGHPLRELHTPAHDTVRIAHRRPGGAGDADAVRHAAQHVRIRRHHHAGRHRQEERDHDDRLRDRDPARERQEPCRGDLRSVPGAFPPDHDDDHGGADGHAADRAGAGRRSGGAQAAGTRGRRRTGAFATAYAVHYAGDLHLHGGRPNMVRAQARRRGRSCSGSLVWCPRNNW